MNIIIELRDKVDDRLRKEIDESLKLAEQWIVAFQSKNGGFGAFDKDNGKLLWKTKLPFGGNATPSTYMVDGRQYVVISAGGGKSNRPRGGMLVAFALPK